MRQSNGTDILRYVDASCFQLKQLKHSFLPVKPGVRVYDWILIAGIIMCLATALLTLLIVV